MVGRVLCLHVPCARGTSGSSSASWPESSYPWVDKRLHGVAHCVPLQAYRLVRLGLLLGLGRSEHHHCHRRTAQRGDKSSSTVDDDDVADDKLLVGAGWRCCWS